MSESVTQQDTKPPSVTVQAGQDSSPVRRISSDQLVKLGYNLRGQFEKYAQDRQQLEQKWLRNLRQYLGQYDPEIERQLTGGRSKAYPRLTRVKCISVLSRLMNLMFPSNEKNWEVKASPSPDMHPEDIQAALQEFQMKQQEAGVNLPLTPDRVRQAVQNLADKRAEELTTLIDDQLQELGGDQTLDYIALNRKVISSGILYGLGVLRGPFVRRTSGTTWDIDPQTQQLAPRELVRYKPMFEFLPVWDFYPDLSAKTMSSMDGYFTRRVMSRSQVRELMDREDFFADQIKKYLRDNHGGNYKAQSYETDLRTMGTQVNVGDMRTSSAKFEVIVWNGPVSGHTLREVGAEVPDDQLANEVDAEIWLLDSVVIKADINPWKQLGVDVKMIHTFLFDEDDTSVIGNGLPNVVRDSQMSVAAAVRMLLDNASIVCGPNVEANTDLLRADQDITAITPYKIWYREGSEASASYPAIRNVAFDAHMTELLQLVDLFMKFSDIETFVGPATGGDMERPRSSEPMRSAAGASMLRADAALPFKDIVRNFDQFTQSVITAVVRFNRKFNPDDVMEGDYNVIARGATSLIAKEIRGLQIDQLGATLSPEERLHVDERKLIEARLASRDLGNLLVSRDEVDRRKAQQAQQAQMAQEQSQKMVEAQIREMLSAAFKNVTQGQKNISAADAATITAALKVMEDSLQDGSNEGGASANRSGSAQQSTH